jgi:FHA domain
MPVILINGQQFALQPGPNRLGGGTTADVNIGDEAGVVAIVDLASDGRATIRKNSDQASIRVNGMALGGPTPLIHGDKVEISGKELFFAEDTKGGSTQFVSSADVAAIAAKRSGPARATASTGGRLVSLVDGKEYAVPDEGVTIGRDASADIVVAQTSVSRRHAQVIASGSGYVVNDLSTNGIYVNGEKVNASQPLSRADVIRVGTEEFRFYADVAPIAPKAAAAAAAAPPAAAPPAPPAPARAPSSPPTPPQWPATPPPPAAAPPPTPTARPMAAPAAKPPATTLPGPVKATPPSAPVKGSASPTPGRAKEAADDAARVPVTMKKGIPSWAGILVVIAIAAVAAYLIITTRR